MTEEDAASPDASPCCICCCEFVAGDHLMALGCGHEFHHECVSRRLRAPTLTLTLTLTLTPTLARCVSRWLRAKRVCPMCKAAVGGTGAMAPPVAEEGGGGDDE